MFLIVLNFVIVDYFGVCLYYDFQREIGLIGHWDRIHQLSSSMRQGFTWYKLTLSSKEPKIWVLLTQKIVNNRMCCCIIQRLKSISRTSPIKNSRLSNWSCPIWLILVHTINLAWLLQIMDHCLMLLLFLPLYCSYYYHYHHDYNGC